MKIFDAISGRAVDISTETAGCISSITFKNSLFVAFTPVEEGFPTGKIGCLILDNTYKQIKSFELEGVDHANYVSLIKIRNELFLTYCSSSSGDTIHWLRYDETKKDFQTFTPKKNVAGNSYMTYACFSSNIWVYFFVADYLSIDEGYVYYYDRAKLPEYGKEFTGEFVGRKEVNIHNNLLHTLYTEPSAFYFGGKINILGFHPQWNDWDASYARYLHSIAQDEPNEDLYFSNYIGAGHKQDYRACTRIEIALHNGHIYMLNKHPRLKKAFIEIYDGIFYSNQTELPFYSKGGVFSMCSSFGNLNIFYNV